MTESILRYFHRQSVFCLLANSSTSKVIRLKSATAIAVSRKLRFVLIEKQRENTC